MLLRGVANQKNFQYLDGMETTAGWNPGSNFLDGKESFKENRFMMKRVACGQFYEEDMRRFHHFWRDERFVQYHEAMQELVEVGSSRQDDASSLCL